jgi:hypothetical protein
LKALRHPAQFVGRRRIGQFAGHLRRAVRRRGKRRAGEQGEWHGDEKQAHRVVLHESIGRSIGKKRAEGKA